MQIIFKAITGSSGHAFWWERTVLHSTETIFDAGLVALEYINPWKGTYYGALRCRTLPSKENFPRQWPAPWFLRQISLSPIECCTFFPTKGRDRNFLLLLCIRFASYQNFTTPRLWKHLYSWSTLHSIIRVACELVTHHRQVNLKTYAYLNGIQCSRVNVDNVLTLSNLTRE